MILCGSNPSGGGVLSLKFDMDGNARIVWFVRFGKGLIGVASDKKNGVLYLLRLDGSLFSAKYHAGKLLRKTDFRLLEWVGEPPWKKLGGVYATALIFRSWKR